jgi:hypothetical protein
MNWIKHIIKLGHELSTVTYGNTVNTSKLLKTNDSSLNATKISKILIK